jgi:F-type H+-transporting ATPase subunit b
MIAQVLNFLILAAILRALAYKPVAKMLKQRADKIQETINKADADKKAAEETLAQYKSQLADAQRRAQEIVDKAEMTARQEREALVAETKKEIERLKQNAQLEIQNERNRAFEQMQKEIVTLSLAAAEKIVEKNLSSKENDKLVSDFIAGLNENMFEGVK